ncbi:MAG: DJ-1/PfpI family protein [Methanoregula sp.]|nr:MAG: DJ-1/PfpI family protein [Methanoregula sp.]
MKLLVAIAPERYRDEELDEPIAAFKKGGIGFDIASTKTGTCKGMLGGTAHASLSFEQAGPSQYAGLVIIGGAGSPPHLWGNKDLIQLAGSFYQQKKIVAAICLSPVVLARAGLLKGKKATFFKTPDSFAEMNAGGAIISEAPVVIDIPVITANGPAAATAFGEAIVARLKP